MNLDIDQSVVDHNPRVVFDGGLPDAVREMLGAAPVAALPHLVAVAVEGVPDDERIILTKVLMGEGLQVVRAGGAGAGALVVAGDWRRLTGLARRPPPGPSSTASILAAVGETLRAYRRPRRVIRHARGTLDLGAAPLVMGVLNVTPDSFSDGGHYLDPEAACGHAIAMLEAGAAIIDIGGESTRPGAAPVDVDEEWRRVAGVIESLADRPGAVLSIDTRKAEIARRALDSGVALVNDVTLLSEESMLQVVSEHGSALIIGHIRGEPRTMQDDPRYVDVVAEVLAELRKKAAVALRAGLDPDTILCDPGIGFGKRATDNLRILSRLDELRSLGVALVLGCSRKSFLGQLLGRGPEERLAGTTATTVLGALASIEVIRVHDVPAAVDAIRVVQAVHEHASLAAE